MGKVGNQKVCGALAQHSPLFALSLETSGEALEAADPQALPGFSRLQAGMHVKFCCLHGFVIVFQINLLG